LPDFQDDCGDGNTWPIVYVPTSTWQCNGEDYNFQVQAALTGFTYYWDFGTYASQKTASGIGPHTIQFDAPTDTGAIYPQVIFVATAPTYEVRDTYNLQVRPLPIVTQLMLV